MVSLFLLTLLFYSQQTEPCMTLAQYLRAMGDLPLENVNLYRHSDHGAAGKIEKLDRNSKPPVFSISGLQDQRPDLQNLCLQRVDIEKLLVYRVTLVDHDNDRLACVSFEEGKGHRKSFQLAAHNRAREIRFYAYRFSSGQWRPVDPRFGFSQEAFSFQCGVRVGNPSLIELVEKKEIRDGQILLLPKSAFADSPEFGREGELLLAQHHGFPVARMRTAGNGPVLAPQPLTRPEKGEVSHFWPEFLSGGKAVLFAAGSSSANWTNAQVAVQSVGTGERRDLVQGGTQPRYAPSGHLVYAQGGNLMAVPFDPHRLEVTGTAVLLVEDVLQSPSTGAAQYSFSATGSLVYIPGGLQAAQRRLVWVNRNGSKQPVAAAARAYRGPCLSPDGRRVAVAIEEQETQVWVYDLARETPTRLTFGGNANFTSLWTPDGKRIAFQSNKEGSPNLFWQLADGSGGLERLTTSEYIHAPMSWSSDGRLLAFIEITPSTGYDIWVLRLSDRKAQAFLRTPFHESAPRFSPDGRWLAYISDETGRYEVYVQPYPGPGGKWQISTEGGTEPVWNPNGRELFYRSGDKMMAVEITTQPGFSAGKPNVLFEGKYLPTPATFPNYDVAPDGQRFLMCKASEQEAAPTQINVVLNWFEELKRRVPTGK